MLNKTATAKSAPISVEVFSAEDVISSDTNNKVAFCVSVVNNSATETISNAKVKIQLADEWVFYDIKEMPPYTYDEKTKTIEFDTGEIVPKQDQGETKQTGEQSYYIEVAADNIKEGVYEKDIPFTATAKIENSDEEYRGNVEQYKAQYANITVNQSSKTEGED